MPAHDLPFDIETAVKGVFNLRCCIAAASYLAIHEWMTMFTSEVKLIHASRWSPMKVGYILCRYYPLVLAPPILWAYLLDHPSEVCQRVLQPFHALLAPLAFIPHGIMLMRAHAFCQNKKTTLVIMLISFTAQVALDLWVYCVEPRFPSTNFRSVMGEMGCFPNYSDPAYKLRIGLAAFITNLVSLVVVILHSRRLPRQYTCLVYNFIRQGFGAFIAITLVTGACAIAYYQPRNEYAKMGIPFMLVLPSFIACRVLLELREQGSRSRTIVYVAGVGGPDENGTQRDDHYIMTDRASDHERPLTPLAFAAPEAYSNA
ncbi:hypothetical protein AX16_006567 [Volvariella volvacea WC 439]|nr:hypothetical protein AX16_006567 [Volvariella volvacea WC 439]